MIDDTNHSLPQARNVGAPKHLSCLPPVLCQNSVRRASGGPSANQRRDRRPRQSNGRDESPVGRPPNPWRTHEVRHRGGRADRLSADAEAAHAALPEMADVPRQSRPGSSLPRCFHRSHRAPARIARFGLAVRTQTVAPPPLARQRQPRGIGRVERSAAKSVRSSSRGMGTQTGTAAPGGGAIARGSGGGGRPARPRLRREPRAASMRRTAWGSVTAPRIRRRPPPRSHTSTSNPNTPWSKRA